MHFPQMAMALFLLAFPLSYSAAQHLECEPCSHGYGRVQIGGSKRYVFELTNTGKKTLHILSKSRNGKAFSFGNFPLPMTLRPGKSAKLPVIFRPTATGKTRGTITLRSDRQDRNLAMDVWGTGTKADASTLKISPSSLNFGEVTVGSSASLQLTLSAPNGSVTISTAQVNSSEFTVSGLELPKTIASGKSIPITVVFAPNASGEASAKLTLISDADTSPDKAQLRGAGVAAGAHSADLSWNASRDPVIGYNVYRGGRKGGPYSRINSVLEASRDYTDSTVNGGTTYYYVVTAVSADNMESRYSNEVKAVIPSP